MAKALQSRKTNAALISSKENELSHIQSLTFHYFFDCMQRCYDVSDEQFYREGLDLKCQEKCKNDFAKLLNSFEPTNLQQSADKREACLTGCFKASSDFVVDGMLCVEKCMEAFDERLTNVFQSVTSTHRASFKKNE